MARGLNTGRALETAHAQSAARARAARARAAGCASTKSDLKIRSAVFFLRNF
jgi:hypothetical protein